MPLSPSIDPAISLEDTSGWVVVDLRALVTTNLGLEALLNRISKGPVEAISTKLGMGPDPVETDAEDFGGTLPTDPTALAFLAELRAQGQKIALVSEIATPFLRQVGQGADLFDAYHGAPEGEVLDAAEKHRIVSSAYPEGFAFMGASDLDLPLWAVAQGAITARATPGLRARVDETGRDVYHLTPQGSPRIPWRPAIKALRPHQWLKNILVFLPLLAAHETDPLLWATAVFAYVAFCLTASSVYILNDLLDLSADRAHQRKRNRPFASGQLPLGAGLILAPGLLLGALLLSVLLLRPLFLLVLLAYYLATLAYSFVLKREVIVDIITLGGLYSIRIIAGGVATMTELSPWILAFSGFFFFSLAAVKRQAELVDLARRGKEAVAGRAYRASDLPVITSMAIAAGYTAVLILAFYISSSEVQELYTRIKVLWLACPVLLFWISRVIMLTHRGQMTDDPIVFAARDIVSWICMILVLTIAIFAQS